MKPLAPITEEPDTDSDNDLFFCPGLHTPNPQCHFIASTLRDLQCHIKNCKWVKEHKHIVADTLATIPKIIGVYLETETSVYGPVKIKFEDSNSIKDELTFNSCLKGAFTEIVGREFKIVVDGQISLMEESDVNVFKNGDVVVLVDFY